MFEGKETLWVIHIGNNDRIALRAREEKFLCIGWTLIGDLSPYNSRDKMRNAMERAFPTAKPATIRSSYGQVYRFAHKMEVGDPVVLPIKPTGEIAIGKIAGEYHFATEDKDLVENDYSNIRPVDWIKIVPRTVFSKAALHSFGSFSTVSTSNDHLEEVIRVATTASAVKHLSEVGNTSTDADQDDEDTANSLFETASQETEDYLLKAWRSTGSAFEHVVAAVFRAMGYTAEATQASGDHGIDVIAHPDPLGIESPYIKVQVKSGSGTVGEPGVNQLKGSVLDSERGILISLGRFTSGAEAVARGKSNITLIGPKKFVSLFLDHYEQLEPDWQAKFPLRKTYIPA